MKLSTDMEVEPPSSPSSSSSTPPAQLPPVTREAQLRQLRELCAKYKIESLVDDPKHVTQCPICSSRCTELFKCGKEGCGKEGCSYLCIDAEDRECFDCNFYKWFENDTTTSQAKYTLADIEAFFRVRSEIGNPARGGWSVMLTHLGPKSDGGEWTATELASLWFRGTADVLECTRNGRRVPLSDPDLVDEDGFLTPFQVDPQHVRVTNAPPTNSSTKQTVDIRTHPLWIVLRVLFPNKGKKDGSFVSPSNLTIDAGTATSSQAVQDQVTVRVRHVLIDAMFLSLCLTMRPVVKLLVDEEHHPAIEDYDEDDMDNYDLASISFEDKRKCLDAFAKVMLGYPDAITSPLFDPSNEIVQTHSDEAIDLMKRLASENFDKHEEEIREALTEVAAAVSICSRMLMLFIRVCYEYLTTHLYLATTLHHNRKRAFLRSTSRF